MNFLIILLIIFIIGFLTATIILIFREFRKRSEHPIPIKPIINHLCRFNGNHKVGQLIKSVPVGKNKNLRKIIYSAKNKDEFGKESIIYETIIAKGSLIIKAEHEDIILPNSPEELGYLEPQYETFGSFIEKNRKFDLLASATDNAFRQISDTFRDSYGGQIDKEIWVKMKQAYEKETNEPKEPEEKNAQ